MPTRNVVLSSHHEKIIESLVSTGRYQNASEVLRDGLRLVEEREAYAAAKLEALRAAACVGFAALDDGQFLDFDSFDDLERHLTDITESASVRSVDGGWRRADGGLASAVLPSRIC